MEYWFDEVRLWWCCRERMAWVSSIKALTCDVWEFKVSVAELCYAVVRMHIILQ